MLQAFFANHDCPVFAQPTWLGAFTHGVDEEATFMNSSKACVQHFMLTQDQHAKAFGILVLSHQAILFFTSGQCEDKDYVFSVSKFSDASCANSIKTNLCFVKFGLYTSKILMPKRQNIGFAELEIIDFPCC